MQVREIMAGNPACCTPEMDLQQAARMMLKYDCGAIPVIESAQSRRLVGIITDRDITCRAVAEGRIPFAMTVSDCMTSAVYSITPDADIEECIHAMREHHVRRIPVCDDSGCCCGMVAQADIARCAPEQEAGAMIRELSLAELAAIIH